VSVTDIRNLAPATPVEPGITGVVLVVEDDPLVQRALGRLFTNAGHRVELFDSLEAFRSQDLPQEPACLVLDLHLPDGNGLQIVDELQADGTPVSAVVITAHGDVPTTVRAMRKGAVELIEKPFDNDQVLRAVAEGLARDAQTRAVRGRRDAARALLDSLSPREREVLDLVVEGLPNKVVASRLGIAEKTVKVHRGRVMGKVGATSLADLIFLANTADSDGP
jgi:FixJ family two-component response regulator